jgi:hypothetical protein
MRSPIHIYRETGINKVYRHQKTDTDKTKSSGIFYIDHRPYLRLVIYHISFQKKTIWAEEIQPLTNAGKAKHKLIIDRNHFEFISFS